MAHNAHNAQPGTEEAPQQAGPIHFHYDPIAPDGPDACKSPHNGKEMLPPTSPGDAQTHYHFDSRTPDVFQGCNKRHSAPPNGVPPPTQMTGLPVKLSEAQKATENAVSSQTNQPTGPLHFHPDPSFPQAPEACVGADCGSEGEREVQAAAAHLPQTAEKPHFHPDPNFPNAPEACLGQSCDETFPTVAAAQQSQNHENVQNAHHLPGDSLQPATVERSGELHFHTDPNFPTAPDACVGQTCGPDAKTQVAEGKEDGKIVGHHVHPDPNFPAAPLHCLGPCDPRSL